MYRNTYTVYFHDMKLLACWDWPPIKHFWMNFEQTSVYRKATVNNKSIIDKRSHEQNRIIDLKQAHVVPSLFQSSFCSSDD